MPYRRRVMPESSTIVDRLRKAGCVFAEEEAEILRSSAGSAGELDAMVAQRASGLPLEQVVGWAEFCGLRIAVDPGVFVPRRRSEFLVQTATGLATGSAAVIVDLCCGTGALGLAVAARLAVQAPPGPAPAEPPDLGPVHPGLVGPGLSESHAVDLGLVELHVAELDPAAVACARKNVEPAGGQVYEGDLFTPLPASLRGRVGILICNAPYVPTDEIAFMPPEAREHEARMALDGGSDGLAILRRVAEQAPGWLVRGGTLLVETSERQADRMADAMTSAGLSARVHADEETGATVLTGTRP
jgi:release factor glutamine methyltransferase